ncbi:MAG: DUF3307 domain-containing protein [Bacteroidota bacterium]
MTVYKLIVLQFIAHLLADFVFQPQRWCDRKEEKLISRYHWYHTIIVFVLSYLLSLDPCFWPAALALTALHFLVDILKSTLLLKYPGRNFFFLDQFIHILIFIGISIGYATWFGINFLIDVKLETIAIVAGFIFCTKPANILVKYIFIAFSIPSPLDVIQPSEADRQEQKKAIETSLPNAGRLIGIVERLLALALILGGQYSAVGLIIAAKSILRFNDTQKTEYVLVGTLLSFGIAILTGILIQLIK